MQNLVALIMKGRVQAILAAVLTLLLALMVTPIAIISMAILVLATLRNGLQEGLIVAISAILALIGLGGLLFQMPMPFALLGILLWLPAWGLSGVLGASHSLAKAFSAAAVGGFLIVGLQFLAWENPVGFWRDVLFAFIQEQIDLTVMPQAEQDQLIDMLAKWMPGGVAASWFISMAAALSLGLWALLKLDDSGSFGAQFRHLRFERFWLIVLPLLFIPMLVASDSNPGVGGQLYVVGMMLFLLQGISVAHAFAHQYRIPRIGTAVFYLALFIGAPYSTIMLAILGYTDGWLDFRAKAGINNQN